MRGNLNLRPIQALHGAEAPFYLGNVGDPTLVESVLQTARGLAVSPSLTFRPDGSLATNNYDRRHSQSFTPFHPDFRPLYAKMDAICREVGPTVWNLEGAVLGSAGQDQGLRYLPGDYFGEHWDSGIIGVNGQQFENRAERKLTCIVYLTSDYDGGDLRLAGTPLHFEAGDFILFGGDRRYPHSVSPVTRGERYCLTRWWSAYWPGR